MSDPMTREDPVSPDTNCALCDRRIRERSDGTWEAVEMTGLRKAATDLLAHHDRQNGVHAGSLNDCESARALREALSRCEPSTPNASATESAVRTAPSPSTGGTRNV